MMRTRQRAAPWSWLVPAALVAIGSGFAFLLPKAASTGPTAAPMEFKYTDEPFRSEMVIEGRTVSCADGETYNRTYPRPMFTCRNISVDGTRIAYGLMVRDDGVARGDDKHLCGSEKGSNSIYWLCAALLSAGTSQSKVWAAYASEVSCDGQEGRRVRFVHNSESANWTDSTGSEGVILSLQCLAERGVASPTSPFVDNAYSDYS